MYRMLIAEIYHKNPKIVHKDATVKEVLKELIKDEINGAIVIDENQEVVGVISLQDIAAATVPSEFRQYINMASSMYKKGFFHEMCQNIKNEPVSHYMRREFVKVTLESNIMAVTADFLKNDLYIVPVIEDKKLIGVVTRTEIKKALAEHMDILKAEEAD